MFLYEDFKTSNKTFLYNFSINLNLDIHEYKSSIKNKRYSQLLLKIARFTNMFSKTQLYTKNRSKNYFFHIPLSFLVLHFFYDKINILIPFKSQFSIKEGSKEYLFLYKLFTNANNDFANKVKFLDIKKHKYPL